MTRLQPLSTVAQPKPRELKPTQKITAAVAIALVPIQLLAFATVSYAIPREARVTYLNPSSGSNVPALREGQGQRYYPAHTNQVIPLRTENGVPQQAMAVPHSSRANLRFDNPSNPLVQLGSSTAETRYLFPCAVLGGSSMVGWTARSDRGCSTFTAHTGSGAIATRDVIYPLAAANKQLLSQAAADVFRYCGTVEDGGPGWGFSAATGNVNPCQQAKEECLETGTGGPCAVSTVGTVALDTADAIATIRCPKAIPITNRGSGDYLLADGLAELKRLARFTNSGNCLIDVYYPGDVVISPASEAATLVEIQTAGNSVEVAALVGNVTLLSADNPRGLLLPEGSSYQSGEGEVATLDCSSRLNSDSVQTFLTPQVWGDSGEAQNIAKTLTDYETEFCQGAIESPEEPTGPRIDIPFPFPFPGPDDGENDQDSNGRPQTYPSSGELYQPQ